MEIKEFKKGDSVLDFCRECKCLMFEDDEDATICLDCMINMTRGKLMKRTSKKDTSND